MGKQLLKVPSIGVIQALEDLMENKGTGSKTTVARSEQSDRRPLSVGMERKRDGVLVERGGNLARQRGKGEKTNKK